MPALNGKPWTKSTGHPAPASSHAMSQRPVCIRRSRIIEAFIFFA
jgi:hypothetical protein